MKFGGDAITRKCLWTYWRTHVLTYSRTDAGLSPCEISSTYSRAKNAEKVIKNTFRIMKTPHAYLQTILKASVKFQKDWPKTVGGVEGTRYLLPIHFCSIRAQKMSTLKMRKKWWKIISWFWKNHMHIFRPSLKPLYSFKRIGQKLWEELRGQGTYSLYTSVALGLKKCLS